MKLMEEAEKLGESFANKKHEMFLRTTEGI